MLASDTDGPRVSSLAQAHSSSVKTNSQPTTAGLDTPGVDRAGISIEGVAN
jgi:hypothetical protein